MNNQDFNFEKNRLDSFKNWTLSFIDKHLLAMIGFYYIGNGNSDTVKCKFCDVEISMWMPEDNPIDEHIRWSLDCDLLQRRFTQNVPIDNENLQRVLPRLNYNACGRQISNHSSSTRQSEENNEIIINSLNLNENVIPSSITKPMHPEFQLESYRLTSFEDWPKSMKQKPKELAEAGFYYTGKGDKVACFSCGGGLKDWEEIDNPFEQHALWYQKCEYLKLIKGQDYINETLSNKTSILSTRPKQSIIQASILNDSHNNNSEEQQTEQFTKQTSIINDSRNSEEQQIEIFAQQQSTFSQIKDDEIASDKKTNKLCKICFECDYNTSFFPCGHVIACSKCASSVNKCPYCRQPFTNKFFLN